MKAQIYNCRGIKVELATSSSMDFGVGTKKRKKGRRNLLRSKQGRVRTSVRSASKLHQSTPVTTKTKLQSPEGENFRLESSCTVVGERYCLILDRPAGLPERVLTRVLKLHKKMQP